MECSVSELSVQRARISVQQCCLGLESDIFQQFSPGWRQTLPLCGSIVPSSRSERDGSCSQRNVATTISTTTQTRSGHGDCSRCQRALDVYSSRFVATVLYGLWWVNSWLLSYTADNSDFVYSSQVDCFVFLVFNAQLCCKEEQLPDG